MASKHSPSYKTRHQNISCILKAHYTVAYVMPNFVFCLLCVSSADVDLWVNGVWDQPNCGVTVSADFFLLLLLNQDLQSKICELLIIGFLLFCFTQLKPFQLQRNLILPLSLLKSQRYSNLLFPNTHPTSVFLAIST